MRSIKKNIFSDSDIEKSIFKDESVFYPDYFPQNILARDPQIKDLTYYLKPIVSKKKANNILISGPPGTGKTLVTNYILDQLTDFSNKVKFIYINCIQDNTRFAVLSKLVSFYNGVLPRRGLVIDEVWQRLTELFSKSEIFPIIVLDEIDKMNLEDSSKLLYDLSRFYINSKFFTLILITNYKSFVLKLDTRTQSSLSLNEIDFLKYKPTEIKQILKERIDFGLIDNCLSQDLLGYVCGYSASRGGDARIAIDLIYKSAKASEKKGKLVISKEIILDSSKLVDSVKLFEKIEGLNKKEQEILNLIEEAITTKELYLKTKIPQRTVRNIIDALERLELISVNPLNIGKGKTRELKLRFDKSLLKK
jgi:cell division control protein 6